MSQRRNARKELSQGIRRCFTGRLYFCSLSLSLKGHATVWVVKWRPTPDIDSKSYSRQDAISYFNPAIKNVRHMFVSIEIAFLLGALSKKLRN